jgi:hypothetical protein
MVGRSYARLDSGELSHPIHQYISVYKSLWRGGAMLDWILVTCLSQYLIISLSRRVYGGEELC